MKDYLKLFVLIGIVLAAVLVARLTPLGDQLTVDNVLAVLDRLRSHPLAPVIFVVAYIAATALALPGSALTLAGGVVFGFWFGALLNTIAANIGANIAFLISRSLGRDGIERLVGKRLQGLNNATRQDGFFGLLILRLVPLVPFNALNFGSGLTALSWRDYTMATLIGILPGTLVYTFFADALIQGSARARWIATGMLVALSLIPIIARKLGFNVALHPSTEAAQ